ncbi:tRNA (adenosine(37)-N6)-dimethylallyltransferase MiaA [Metabacillus arenae]|uniref:tRNA dimethylallyltransferase n=1 Tax=Metabacillus arenae TaxID=2771434 RepID=A0A926RWM3_9BACI|nr:tRNA (adenosine(37)-N6)-dimethylallyltransferase MiaA [Metabacillus arenae]MBD1379307.1 tRNA (adenosine(37)-N6)-dimethylallyltransferase MiaA [Metabacillus arenae]
MGKEKLVVLIGPTAVGKTNLSIQLAKKLNAEIISGDSMQVYRTMDIGTAKITVDEMQGVPHHLIDIKDPEEDFSVAEFQEMVRELIGEIHKRNKMPMIVGGTGLYIQSVLYDYHFTEEASDGLFRKQMEELYLEKGIDPLYNKLKMIDPEAMKRIHPNNVRRVIRALEIYHVTGKTMTEYLSKQKQDLYYDDALIGLTMDRTTLYNRINRRVDLMIQNGLIQEVRELFEKGVKDCQSIQAIGYKELYHYFEGKIDLDTAIEQLKQNSRRYSKRQLTWFRNKMNVKWFDMTPPVNELEKVNEIFTYTAGKLES